MSPVDYHSLVTFKQIVMKKLTLCYELKADWGRHVYAELRNIPNLLTHNESFRGLKCVKILGAISVI